MDLGMQLDTMQKKKRTSRTMDQGFFDPILNKGLKYPARNKSH